MQVGVYPTRFIEHIACVRIASMDIIETKLGNSHPTSDCRMAVSMIMLAFSGIALVLVHALLPATPARKGAAA